jgi:hypothetical protein
MNGSKTQANPGQIVTVDDFRTAITENLGSGDYYYIFMNALDCNQSNYASNWTTATNPAGIKHIDFGEFSIRNIVSKAGAIIAGNSDVVLTRPRMYNTLILNTGAFMGSAVKLEGLDTENNRGEIQVFTYGRTVTFSKDISNTQITVKGVNMGNTPLITLNSTPIINSEIYVYGTDLNTVIFNATNTEIFEIANTRISGELSYTKAMQTLATANTVNANNIIKLNMSYFDIVNKNPELAATIAYYSTSQSVSSIVCTDSWANSLTYGGLVKGTLNQIKDPEWLDEQGFIASPYSNQEAA